MHVLLYHQPALTRFVADFVGEGAFPARPGTESGLRHPGNRRLLPAGCRWAGLAEGCRVDVLLRPDDVQLEPDSTTAKWYNAPSARPRIHSSPCGWDSGNTLLALAPGHQRIDVAAGPDSGWYRNIWWRFRRRPESADGEGREYVFQVGKVSRLTAG